MLPNTLGSVMKTSSGPDVGLMPYEKTAGKIASPARIATQVSVTATVPASRNMFSFLGMYDP